MSLTIEKGRYFKKMSPTFKYKDYLLAVFNKIESTEKIDDLLTNDIVKENLIRVQKADKIIDLMTKLIAEYKGVPCGKRDNYDQWYEILVTAAYLYSLFHEEKQKIVSLVYAREYTRDTAAEIGVRTNDLEFIFQAVEASMGFFGPQKWKPSIDTPGEMLTLAIYLIENKDRLEEEMD